MIITKCGSHYKNTLIPTGSQVMTAKNTDGQQVVLMLLDYTFTFTLEVKWRLEIISKDDKFSQCGIGSWPTYFYIPIDSIHSQYFTFAHG